MGCMQSNGSTLRCIGSKQRANNAKTPATKTGKKTSQDKSDAAHQSENASDDKLLRSNST